MVSLGGAVPKLQFGNRISSPPDVASDMNCLLFLRPPERRHGYEQQFHSITSQSEHEALESKRPRMETVAESHISRNNPTAGGIVLPLTHAVQDSLRATVDVKKVGPSLLIYFCK